MQGRPPHRQLSHGQAGRPYLIALAIGDLKFRPLSAHTGIWTEPAMLDKSAWEFAGLDKFVTAAEGLYGPYRWGRYDVLVLPPSFPFGGMENPTLTFATPTVLAGDRSLVSLIAHELAHSWSGNLVTNATWDDFWLNEGFTSYFENRIMESMYGKRRAAMEADLAWTDMQNAVKEAGGPQSPDTKLHLDLNAARDPDDGMTQIAYDKGATFLRTIESVVGRPRWDAYLRSYFDRHAFQPQTSAGFVADLRRTCSSPARTPGSASTNGSISPASPPTPSMSVPTPFRDRRGGQGVRGRWSCLGRAGQGHDAGICPLPRPAAPPAVGRSSSPRSTGGSTGTRRATVKSASPGCVWRSPIAIRPPRLRPSNS